VKKYTVVFHYAFDILYVTNYYNLNIAYKIHICHLLILILIYLLIAIGLTAGGNSRVHIYKQTIHRTIQFKLWLEGFVGFEPRLVKLRLTMNSQRKNYRLMGRVRAVSRLCDLYPGICLTIEKKAQKNLIQVRETSVRVEKTSAIYGGSALCSQLCAN
jgi:hypothetical protein